MDGFQHHPCSKILFSLCLSALHGHAGHAGRARRARPGRAADGRRRERGRGGAQRRCAGGLSVRQKRMKSRCRRGCKGGLQSRTPCACRSTRSALSSTPTHPSSSARAPPLGATFASSTKDTTSKACVRAGPSPSSTAWRAVCKWRKAHYLTSVCAGSTVSFDWTEGGAGKPMHERFCKVADVLKQMLRLPAEGGGRTVYMSKLRLLENMRATGIHSGIHSECGGDVEGSYLFY